MLMQSTHGQTPASQDMSDSEEDVMPARARAMEVDDDDEVEAEDVRGGGGHDFESDESDSDAVADGDGDEDGDDDDDDDDDSEEDSGAETDMDASDEDDEEDDSDDSGDSEDDDDSDDDDKKKKQAPKKKNTKKPVSLRDAVPSLKFLKRNLKSVKLFMDVVDAHMRKTDCTLYKAVDDVKKRMDADTEDLYSSICLLNEEVSKFTQLVTGKLESDDRPDFANAAQTLLTECVVLADSQYAPALFIGATDKPCTVSGKNTTMRLAVFKDTFKTYIEERTAAKERGDQKPAYNNNAVPKRLAVPVTPEAAPLLVQFVVAGSTRQLYNPALKRINLNVYAAAAHDAMCDIARFI